VLHRRVLEGYLNLALSDMQGVAWHFGCSVTVGDLGKEVAPVSALQKKKKAGRQMAPQMVPAGCASHVGETRPPLNYGSQHAQRAQPGAAVAVWPQCMLGAVVSRLLIGARGGLPALPAPRPSCCGLRWRPRWTSGTASSSSSSRRRTGRRRLASAWTRRRRPARKLSQSCESGCGAARRRCGGCGRRISWRDWRGLRRAGTGGCLLPPDPFRARLRALRCSRAALGAGRGAARLWGAAARGRCSRCSGGGFLSLQPQCALLLATGLLSSWVLEQVETPNAALLVSTFVKKRNGYAFTSKIHF